MLATRILLSQPTVKGLQIQPQRTLDILKSAGSACVSLLSQENRDNFLASLNGGIIKPEVLGQADMGMAKILALHNDLNSPLFSKHKFNVEEFTEGVKPALCRFHEVQSLLQNEVYNEKNETDSKKEQGEDEKDLMGGIDKETEQMLMREFLALSTTNTDNDVLASKISDAVGLKRNWTKEAKEQPESLAGQLMSMLTTSHFQIVEFTAYASYLTDRHFRYVDDSVKINNVALLSARAMEISDVANDMEEERPPIDEDRPMTDETLDGPSKKSAKNNELPVAVQMEVLYDVKMDYKNVDSDGKEVETNDGEELSRVSILVAVFEAWLHGDPDGSDSVRWKLAFIRPAWEFPIINQYA
mmetsp:Transcript_4891/g.6714  ORF Transcript_4891/g.6714 Transcript_4891/m.6714 type:complete len:357 (-) Transcript_4891:44-1114(-)